MSVKPIKLNSMVGASWGQKGTLPIPNGPTYHELILETNASAADMLRIAITLHDNGCPWIDTYLSGIGKSHTS
ncbi:hypothetical protein BCT47_10905 [Vibrio splendidus]|uniref:Major capsid protein P2 n=1 Tax=Vibrio splendidus TaxID=29497 RepID=A0AB35N277_VIBSP|nr:major capsid protein P2 [Vibrio splendidus]MDP2502588.1 major capsid protein P2 [Vibrio splendidus]PMM68505.1 hypothetical protein BCT47_10905 [Vibrio splendidus]